MASYPVIFDVDQQERYDRVHIAIRLGIIIILSIIGGAIGWVFGLLYLAVPVVAAILIAQKGAESYFAESEQNMTKWLRWVAQAASYVFLLTDKAPIESGASPVRFDVTPAGTPSPGAVLLRIILAIPHAIVLFFVGIIAFVLMIVAAILILVQEKYPEGIFNFIRADIRWNARVYVYLAGLAQDYPPFALDMGAEGGGPIATGVAPAPSAPDATTGAQT